MKIDLNDQEVGLIMTGLHAFVNKASQDANAFIDKLRACALAEQATQNKEAPGITTIQTAPPVTEPTIVP